VSLSCFLRALVEQFTVHRAQFLVGFDQDLLPGCAVDVFLLDDKSGD
jgi:hypothetical protein